MSSAVANASRGVSTKRFVNVSCGAYAMECTMMSSPPSCVADLLERPVDAGVGRDVALDDDVGPGLLGELSHAALEALALVGEREPRAGAVKRLRDRPRDRPLVGHARHQRELAVQNPVGHVSTPFPLAPVTLARPEFDSVEPGGDRLERLRAPTAAAGEAPSRGG